MESSGFCPWPWLWNTLGEVGKSSLDQFEPTLWWAVCRARLEETVWDP